MKKLIRYAVSSSTNKNLIILIEEPESHLHPKAIHGIRQVLIDLSQKYQIIASSHSQLLIDKLNVRNNILVQKGGAEHATDIRKIRDVLGVQVTHNLDAENFVILLEGLSDIRFLEKILTEKSKYYTQLKHRGRVILDNLQGCSKATYKASLYKNLLLEVFLILDSDTEGLASLKEVITKGILTQSETLKIAVPGMSNSELEDLAYPPIEVIKDAFYELEDLIDYNYYKDIIFNNFSVNIDNSDFKNLNKPWSDRIKKEFTKCGQTWDENVEKLLKEKVADIVVEHGYSCILNVRRPFIDNLINVIDSKLEKIK